MWLQNDDTDCTDFLIEPSIIRQTSDSFVDMICTFTNFLCLLERLKDKFYKYQLGSKMLFSVSYGLWTKKIIAKILH